MSSPSNSANPLPPNAPSIPQDGEHDHSTTPSNHVEHSSDPPREAEDVDTDSEPLSRRETPGRAMTTVSSSATLCHYSSDDEDNYFSRHKTKDSVDHPPTIEEAPAPAQPPAQSPPPANGSPLPPRSTNAGPSSPPPIPSSGTVAREEAPPPIHGPDLVSFFDPASAGGGGPLRRITTQQRERAEAEARERAERQHREAAGLPPLPVSEGYSSGGILNRFRSGSMTSKRRARFVTPLLHHDEETQSRASMSHSQSGRPTLSTLNSNNTLASTPNDKDSRYSSEGKEGRDLEEQKPDTLTQTHEESVPQYVYPDGGYGWIVIVCCMTLAGCTMGQGMNYGAYQAFYTNTAFPGVDSGYIGVVGTSNAFFMNGAAFIFGRMGDRYGYKRVLYASAIVTWIGMFSASFCSKPWQLLLTQGCITGLGQGMAMPLFMSLPSQWFYKRRGLASGMALSGAGFGGGTSILVVRQLLAAVGYKKTLLITSFINATFTLVAIVFIKTRSASPEAAGGGRGPWADKKVVKSSGFWSIALSLITATLGYGAPWIYLQSWVEKNLPGTSPVLTALPPTLVSFCLAFGRAMIGAVADVIGPLNTYILVFALSSVIQMALWYTAKSFAAICAFSIMYGLVAPGFIGLIPQMVVQLFGPANLASNVGLLILFNGPGNLAGGPIAGAIYDASGRTTFKWVIVVDSCLQAGGAIIALWARFKASRRVRARV